MLLIDAGNSRLKWGVWQASGWLEQGSLANDNLPDRAPWQAFAPFVAAWVAQVGPAHVADWVRQHTTAHAWHWPHAMAQQCGVENRYRQPEQLGVDRWLALIAARGRHAGPLLVVSSGTAVTVDALDGAGVFLGGAILPGLGLMRAALTSRTAQLQDVPGQWQRFPRDTADAIQTGCVNAIAGAIRTQWQALAELQPPQLCLLTGGDAAELMPHLPGLPVQREDNLVLEGLLRVAQS